MPSETTMASHAHNGNTRLGSTPVRSDCQRQETVDELAMRPPAAPSQ